MSSLLLVLQRRRMVFDVNEMTYKGGLSPVEKRRVRCGIHAGYVTVISFGLRVAGLLRMLHPRVFFKTRLR